MNDTTIGVGQTTTIEVNGDTPFPVGVARRRGSVEVPFATAGELAAAPEPRFSFVLRQRRSTHAAR